MLNGLVVSWGCQSGVAARGTAPSSVLRGSPMPSKLTRPSIEAILARIKTDYGGDYPMMFGALRAELEAERSRADRLAEGLKKMHGPDHYDEAIQLLKDEWYL